MPDATAAPPTGTASGAGGTPGVPFVLGIDPGQTTGLAGFVPAGGRRQRGRLAFVTSAGPLGTVRQLEAWAEAGLLLAVYVEDATALPLYARHRGAGRGERDRIARSVGRVDAWTDLYLNTCAALRTADGAPVPAVSVEPVRAAKWTADVLRRVTGYDGRTNQHGRDAARIVWGRRVPGPAPAGRPRPTENPT